MKTLLLCLASLAIGIALGAAWFRGPTPPELSSELREKFQQLTAADIEEYYRLKSAEEKFRKADEILGKIMEIFLADLGLHVSQHAIDASREHFTPPPQAVSESRAVKLPAAPVPPVAAPPLPNRVRLFQDSRLEAVRNDADAEPYLKKLQFDNLDLTLSTAKGLTNSALVRKFNGSFEGSASVDYGGHHHDWEVSLSLQGALGKGGLQGTALITISENGQIFSNATDKGSQDEFRELPGDPNTVLLKASPQIVFQLYYLNELGELAGNVYRRASEEKPFFYAGTAFLRRL